LNMTGSSSSKMARKLYTSYQGQPHHFWLEMGPHI
jgi:hypothetical protein